MSQHQPGSSAVRLVTNHHRLASGSLPAGLALLAVFAISTVPLDAQEPAPFQGALHAGRVLVHQPGSSVLGQWRVGADLGRGPVGLHGAVDVAMDRLVSADLAASLLAGSPSWIVRPRLRGGALFPTGVPFELFAGLSAEVGRTMGARAAVDVYRPGGRLTYRVQMGFYASF